MKTHLSPKGPIHSYRNLLRAGVIRADPSQEMAAGRLQHLHKALKRHARRPGGFRRIFAFAARKTEAPPGLYIHGDVGRGKSMLMDIFFETAPTPKKRRIHFHRFMLEVHADAHAFRQAAPEQRGGHDPVPAIAERIADEAGLLCFDEFQVSDIADAMILGRLFEALFARGVTVVLTSNREPDELYKGGLNRQLFLPFIALVKQRLEICNLDGVTDYRLEQLSRIPVYLTPLGAESAQALEANFTGLTGGREGAPTTIEAQGRSTVIPRAANGVAFADFESLCGRPLGAADYLALAAHHHTLLLAGIPKMTREKRNEAKRFATLVDALYENRTKLVCTADAPPHELYPAGDGAFEFRRIASRLMEMQSQDYLALPHASRDS